MTPNDHMSEGKECPNPPATSGERKFGVPHVYLFNYYSHCSLQAKPKSPILILS
jgi:hypothetical protein